MVHVHPISVKLKETKFLPWKQQAWATIKGHKLHTFLDEKAIIPQQYVNTTDASNNVVTKAYALCEEQDQLLIS